TLVPPHHRSRHRDVGDDRRAHGDRGGVGGVAGGGVGEGGDRAGTCERRALAARCGCRRLVARRRRRRHHDRRGGDVFALMTEHLAWYVARSAGILAWALSSASIMWGLALSTRLIRKRGVPAWLLDFHRFLGVLTLVAVGVHLLRLWVDTYVYFGWRELFVPFGSAWRPIAVLWGIAATYCLVAIQLTP